MGRLIHVTKSFSAPADAALLSSISLKVVLAYRAKTKTVP